MNKENKQNQLISDEEDDPDQSKKGFFAQLFKLGSRPASVQQAHHNDMALNLSHLKEARVSDIAVPKADIVALAEDADVDSFFETLREYGYSRIPVFRETLDEPLGLVHVKDLFMTYGFDMKADRFTLEPFIRPLIYTPPSMKLVTLLQRMQSEHIHMALVIDEYGGVDGLVTIEDILEQIVGDITDEHDDTDEDLWQHEKPGVYLVHARTQIDDFTQETNVELPLPEDAEDVDTIGGLIMALVARVPAKGEVIKSENGYEFEIVEADPRRIKRVRIRLPRLHSEVAL